MKSLVKNFLQGCLVLVPTVCTGYVVYFVFQKVDGLVSFPVPGIGFAATIVMIILIGAFTTSFLGKGLFRLAERILTRVPVVKLLYTTLRDLVGAFVGEQRSFDRPVVVTLADDSGPKMFGFITSEDLHGFGLDDHVAVYFPQSVNFAGNLLMFPRDRVRAVEVDNARFMAFIVSGGVVKGPQAEAA